MGQQQHHPDCHFLASFVAAIINFPLWRASARAQSGFKLEGANLFHRYYKAVADPPYRGVVATMLGMTWARGIIFYSSDFGKSYLLDSGFNDLLATTMPPTIAGICVQFVNMPVVRGTITIQDPGCRHNTVRAALLDIYSTRGIKGLWHGTSAGIMKTVPKYVTAVVVRNWCEHRLPHFGDASDPQMKLIRSAVKSVAAGVAGAALTNPLDVIRNEMFKTDLPLSKTCSKLFKEEGWTFATR